MEKINALAANCELLDNFYLSSFRLRIYDSTQRILFCGYDTLTPPLSIEIRYVKIGSDYGNITLEMW